MSHNEEMILVNLPDRYLKVKSLPDDPPYSVAYGYENDGSGCFIMTYPIPADRAMPYENSQEVVDGIHASLGDDQGLIEVENGKTEEGHSYIYSIVKSLKQPHGVQYCMTMHIDYVDYAVQVQGFFDEIGTTGIRDALIFAQAQNQNLVKVTEKGIEGWNQDPYDPSFDHGNMMNMSERREYDELFPAHPLSEARRFVTEMIKIN